MYNNPYFIPNFYSNIAPSMIRGGIGNAALRGLGQTRGINLFGRLGNSLNAIKSINWSGIINNTSKTLGIINQSIPIVKQVGPMMNNMKSMLRIASIFKDETDIPYHQHTTSHTSKSTNPSTNTLKREPTFINKTDDYSPTFFIPS